MPTSSFEDRLSKINAKHGAPMPAHDPAPALASGDFRLDHGDDSMNWSAMTVPGILGFIAGAFLAVIIKMGMMPGSPWGPGTPLSDIVLIPTFMLAAFLVLSLLPAAFFAKTRPGLFGFSLAGLVGLIVPILL